MGKRLNAKSEECQPGMHPIAMLLCYPFPLPIQKAPSFKPTILPLRPPASCLPLVLSFCQSRNAVAHKRRVATSTHVHLAPQTRHEIITRRIVSVTHSARDGMMVIHAHALPKIVFAKASPLTVPHWQCMGYVLMRWILERVVVPGSRSSIRQ